ncbi:MAG TPA: CbtA family protein [Acidimicrobiales bacterium]|nr:CbtA family protein [Acidimicrobiales bacterium]
MRRLLRDGAVAGLAGGAALALVLLAAGEPTITRAIELEQRARGGGAGDQVFSRGAQQVGGGLAALVWGLAVGAIFAVAYVALRRQLQTRSDWRAAVTLAAVGFVTITLVPFLKYPANPPGVGDADTVGRRTTLFLLMLAWSLLSTAAAWRAARVLARPDLPLRSGHAGLPLRSGHAGLAEHLRLPLVGLLYLFLVAIGLAALPGSPDEVAVPATLVWRFRLASLAGTAAFWVVCGTVFGWLHIAAGRAGERSIGAVAGRG